MLKNARQKAQWKDWFAVKPKKDLFNQKGEVNEAFLEQHPTLVVDTRNFDPEWTRQLVESLPFDDLDDATDGLLVHGENYQALHLLLEKYRKKVKCIHIDPPYNTQTSIFLYKNAYQHSSWLAMMENRIRLGFRFMPIDGSYLCHIDENEYEHLQLLFDSISIPDAGTIAWDKRNPMNAGRGVATQHEYIIWRSRQETPIYLRNSAILSMLTKAAAIVSKYGNVSEAAQKEYSDWVNKNPELSGGEKAYHFLDEQGRVYRGVSLRAPEPRTDPKFHKPLIHPITGKPCAIPPNGFSRTPETLQAMVERGEIIFGPDETTQPNQKRFLTEDSKRQISSVIQNGRKGKADVFPLGLDFPYCHPVSLYEELVGSAAHSPTDIVLDYFAGSGTTGHAVINLNREDGSQRKFVLVEVGEYFDTVLLPRIAKVMFTPEWKEGRPKRMATREEAERTPRLVKVLRLESYEDSLNNVAAPSNLEKVALREKAYREVAGENEYRLKYLISLPLESSETMLNLSALEHPFDCTLEILTEEGPKRKPVDLMETFNYLYGLRVRKVETWANEKDKIKLNGSRRKSPREYRVVKATDREQKRRVLVVWRDMTGLDPEVERKFLETGVKDLAGEGENYDEFLINGDTAATGFVSLDPVFKRLMMAGEEESP